MQGTSQPKRSARGENDVNVSHRTGAFKRRHLSLPRAPDPRDSDTTRDAFPERAKRTSGLHPVEGRRAAPVAAASSPCCSHRESAD